MSVIRAQGVTKVFSVPSLHGPRRMHTALDDVSLTLDEGETVALLGRSGCGKSTLAQVLLGLQAPTTGQVLFREAPIQRLKGEGLKQFRRSVQLVFQDSVSAVNARFTIGDIIEEPLRHLSELTPAQRKQRVHALLRMVELGAEYAERLPVQVSGGQLQRVCIARALALQPQLIILDEAVSNLDVHLQASALDLLRRLQREHGMAYLFVTHDLRLVERFAARCLVMDEGRIVEQIHGAQWQQMVHPASRLLRQAVLPAMPRERA